jgi:NAD(P)-dependent dehydrogenase (short-subunit alcohol dehydrogenase family)
MGELRFDGRTVIVTGAGGNPSLGRAHALLLAERGANVVVNDIGGTAGTPGATTAASAEAVVEEIRARGGKAVADTNSVATEAGANAIVQTALDAFGRIDALVNNAAICIVVAFDEVTPEDFQRHVEVNLMGPVWTSRAVWPHMRAQGYGRIVNISSASLAGFEWQAPYAASKGGLFSLTRALAAEGEALGIKVNTVNPGGFTRMVGAQHTEASSFYKYSQENLPPALVSPVVALLAHADCPVSGECIEAMGGKVNRFYLARTEGFTDKALTIETLAARWGEVMAGSAAGVIGHNDYSPRDWDLKPYQPGA